MARENELPEPLRKSLDLENFEVIRIIPKDDLHPVVVMRDKRAESKGHWCIQHRGSGYYFQTLKEATDYLITRNWIKAS
ncbi:hypothetical protein [Heliorestis convoluta]|uniref:Uncharacterized protein n=1 Tax=Heliorestis convoluta TaxID=356322 RepID=A0A5Q2N0U9_9FIRM|nr:hypothetical protein [Heliorestis convoluta]QGG47403.1 hypothetical protein FTV88_1256 [Heliorestis convoluta]